MAVYLGTEKKRRLRWGSILIRIPGTEPFDGILLVSLDDFKLRDMNNLQLTAQEEVEDEQTE